jgi:hypothetical protein
MLLGRLVGAIGRIIATAETQVIGKITSPTHIEGLAADNGGCNFSLDKLF